jgi:hypothetical protein
MRDIFRARFLSLCTLVALNGCFQQPKIAYQKPPSEQKIPQSDDKKPINPLEPGSPYFCPQGAQYSFASQFCVQSGKALGPFTKKMVALCKSESPQRTDCDEKNWPEDLAARLRGSDICPAGATQIENGFCAEGNEIYGPFVHERVAICKELNGGPACEWNRWSIHFAETTRKVPEPPAVPPTKPDEEAFERYIAPIVYRLIREDAGLGYSNTAAAQHSRDLFYNSTKIFSVGTKASHCVGMTFQALVMAMNQYFSDTKDSRVWSLSSRAMKWQPFKNCWYVNSAEGKYCYGARDAIVRYGLGVAVKDFSDLKIGDFVNYDRANGSGHSVIFMGFLTSDGKKVYNYSSQVVGFEYFSSQGSTKGAGLVKAKFSRQSCAGAQDCGIIKNSLVMGRVLHPSKFIPQSIGVSLMGDAPDEEVSVPGRYLHGN